MSGYTYDRIWERLSALYNASSTSYHVSDLLSRWISERNLDWGYKLVDFYSARVPSAGSVGDAANEYWSGGVLSDALVWFDAEWSAVSSGVWKNLGTAGSSYGAIVGSQPTSDANDPTLLPWSGENYLYLPGVASNYASVPDAAALDITGDIEIVVRVALDDWTPTSQNGLLERDNGDPNRFMHFAVTSTGLLRLRWFSTGSVASSIIVDSTVAPTVANGDYLWLKVTHDVDNGSSGNDVRFYTAPDQPTEPTVWTQLGATVTTAGVTSHSNVTSALILSGAASLPLAGKYKRAIVRNGIGGSNVLDVDFTTGITSGGQTSFTATTGQTVTISRSATGRKAVAVVRPVWLFGTDDYMQVPADPDGAYVTLNGTSQFVSCPDAAGLDVTGDIELVCRANLDNWSPATNMALISKWGTSPAQRSYQMGVVGGNLYLYISSDGLNNGASEQRTAILPPAITNGVTYWVKATKNATTGLCSFYYAADQSAEPTSWTLISSSTMTYTGGAFSGTATLEIGCVGNGLTFFTAGRIYRAIVRNGIGGTIVADWQACGHPANGEAYADAYSNLWSMTGSPTLSNPNRLNFALGDSFTVLAVVRHWATPPSFARIVIKATNGATHANYMLLNHNANGKVYFTIASATGVGTNTAGGVPTYSMGQSVVLTGIRNTVTDKLGSYFNTTDYGTTPTDPTTGAISNAQPLVIGGVTGSYSDMELLAVAVIPRALTTTEIEAICRHYGTL